MKRYNTGPLEKSKQKKTFDNNDPLFKCNKTIHAYINSKLNNIEKKNNSTNKPPKPKRRLPNKLIGNQYTINSSTSTMFSDKSNNNKDYNSPSQSLNGEILEKEDYHNNLILNEQKIEKIIEENENLKQELILSKNKVLNLEEILQSIIKESLPLSKNECPIPTPEIKKYSIPKKIKCQRIISYSREKDGDKITKYVKSPEEIKRFHNYFILKNLGE
jgi:predicted RNase H-like nuclease (RuvC/YqgF family)